MRLSALRSQTKRYSARRQAGEAMSFLKIGLKLGAALRASGGQEGTDWVLMDKSAQAELVKVKVRKARLGASTCTYVFKG